MTPKEVKAARLALGFTQQRLADEMGLADSRIVRRWEAGDRNPSPVAERLLQALLDGWRFKVGQ